MRSMEDIVDEVVVKMGAELAIEAALKKLDKVPPRAELYGATVFALFRGDAIQERMPMHVRVAARLLKAKRVAIPITVHNGNRSLYEAYRAYAQTHGLDIPGA